MRSLLFLVVLLSTVTACRAEESPVAAGHSEVAVEAQARAGYTNPVLDEDFADPMVLRVSDGTYWAYATQRPVKGRWINVPTYKSTDMVHWTFVGDAMPSKPGWAGDTQNIWAPHVLEDGGKFYLYFASETERRGNHGLGVAVGDSPAGPFKPTPKALVSGDGFEHIDAFPYDDPVSGKKLLYWGSGFRPIHLQELAPDRLRFAKGSERFDVLHPSDRPYERLIEGAWLTRRNGWYYMFYSGDNCCAEVPTYNVMVARSKSPFGPFEKLADATGAPDSRILHDSERWKGPGHNAVVTDGKGQDWMIYHAIDVRQRFLPNSKAVRRPMLIDKLIYEGGWPHIADDRPSESRRSAPQR